MIQLIRRLLEAVRSLIRKSAEITPVQRTIGFRPRVSEEDTKKNLLPY
jgi:hypothetical protein